MSKYLSISLIIISTIVGMGIGYVLTPEYASQKEDLMMGEERNDKYTDLRYINHLIGHHEQAIHMAEQAQEKSQRTEIKELSKTVIEVDTKAIEELYDWKEEWYGDTTKVEDYEKVNLGEYDDKFDLRFINAMIRHHEEAVNGAKEIQTKSSRNEILNLSDSIILGLSDGITTLETWRYDWYQIK